MMNLKGILNRRLDQSKWKFHQEHNTQSIEILVKIPNNSSKLMQQVRTNLISWEELNELPLLVFLNQNLLLISVMISRIVLDMNLRRSKKGFVYNNMISEIKLIDCKMRLNEL